MPDFGGVDVIFKDLTCSISSPATTKDKGTSLSKSKVILNGISGIFPKGQLTAIMGTSGAGKTTLLQAISGQLANSNVTVGGDIYINSRKVESNGQLRKLSAFVHQEDCIEPWMTVEEALLFSGRLRFRGTYEQMRAKLERTIDLLEISQIRDSLVGSSSGSGGARGISGGERKRVAIAMELMSDPSVLFLDEPTTGLDTFMAWRVIEIMFKLARVAGYTVVMIIHQPPSCVFAFFDNLLLLGADGHSGARVIYQGKASGALEYFAGLGYECGRTENPSDFFFMKILNLRNKRVSYSEEAGLRVKMFLDQWEYSQEQQQFLEMIEDRLKKVGEVRRSVFLEVTKQSKWRMAFRRYKVIFVRICKSFWRSKSDMYVFIFLYPIFDGLLVGLTYLNLGRYPALLQLDLRAAAIFFLANSQFAAGTEHWVNTTADQRKIFNREYGAKYYGLLPYILAKITFEIILAILTASTLVLICYYMIGLAPPFSSALFLILTGIIAYLGGCGFGFILISLLTKDSALSTLIIKTASKPLSVAGGLYAVSIPAFMIWLKYISPVYYAFSAGLQDQLNSRPCRENGDGECIALADKDLFALLKFDAVFPPGVCIVLGIAVAVVFLTAGFTMYRIRFKP